ncbi:FliM/FliN family flagellar motor switch protein [Sphingomonas sp. MS122]|uniref:FliM/FliN family flagellar motor switch protein n=1 Tax=Sphingomonas sp. MS122 TaxID=3412683 RepID=UPI003C2BAA52
MQDTILSDTLPDSPDDAPPPAEEAPAAAVSPPPEEKSALDGRFSVPITIELESTAVPLAELQAIREGAVLPLDTEAGSIPVRLLASGKPFARGTLISVGEGYGVLIEAE